MKSPQKPGGNTKWFRNTDSLHCLKRERRWMEGRMDGWMDGWMDEWKDGKTDRGTCGILISTWLTF
jgi:hypothetical protein